MKYWLSLLISVGLGACAQAGLSVTESDVSIRYDANLDSDEELQAIADEECASIGRKAVFRRSTRIEGGDLRYAHFTCIDASFGRSTQIPGLDGRRRLRD
jgi:hypothetical protein